MKRIIILFFALGSILTYSQDKFKEVFTDLRTVEIAKIEKGLVQVTIDKESLIETINPLASASILLVSKSKHTSVTLARAGELDA